MHTPVFIDELVRFGVFEADLRSGELRKCGAKVKIQERPFQALRLLLNHPNEIVNRDQLRQALWPEHVYVDFDRGVISAINRLRDALGDSAENPVFIETVGRRGYRWIAPTLHATAELELRQDAVSCVETVPEPHGLLPSPDSSQAWKWLLFVPALIIFVTGAAYRFSLHAQKASAFGTPTISGTRSTASPVNPEAEDFYLKGRFYWNQRTPESLNKAVDFFTQAIVRDPNYAPAYVGLADCYNLLREYSAMPSSEAYSRALAAAKRAAALDDLSSEAHASLAFVSFNGMWDVAAADREYRRALELDPKNSTAHHWYATTLTTLTRYPEALAEIERAQALDPASKSILADKGLILWLAGRKNEAIAILQPLEAAEPAFISPHRYLKEIYQESGDYRHYLAEMKHEATLTHNHAEAAIVEAASKGFAVGGGRGLLEGQLHEQKRLLGKGQVSPYLLAETCVLLGEKAEAQHYLDAAYATRADEVPNIENEPIFRSLHGEPAFRQLVLKIGLPPLI